MQDNGVNVQKFRVAATKDDAAKISQSFSEFIKIFYIEMVFCQTTLTSVI